LSQSTPLQVISETNFLAKLLTVAEHPAFSTWLIQTKSNITVTKNSIKNNHIRNLLTYAHCKKLK